MIKLLGVIAAIVVAIVSMSNLVYAEAPPEPPSRFVGQVLIEGVVAPNGSLVVAVLDNKVCASAKTFSANGQSRYVIDIPASCSSATGSLSFTVSGLAAHEHVNSWANYQLQQLDLTVTLPVKLTTPPTAGVAPRPPATGQSVFLTESINNRTMVYARIGLFSFAFSLVFLLLFKRNK